MLLYETMTTHYTPIFKNFFNYASISNKKEKSCQLV